MRISDWSSDVCSSDLLRLGFGHALDEGVGEELGVHLVPRRHPLEGAGPRLEQRVRARGDGGGRRGGGGRFGGGCDAHLAITHHHRGGCKQEDRKRVVKGRSVSVRVDLGGRRIITKKKYT